MADNVAITAGSGTTIAADEVNDGTLGTCKAQYVKVMDGTIDGTNKMVISSSGEVLVKGAVTATVTTASKIVVDAITTASKIQVDALTTASKIQIDALTTASKVQVEFAAAQAVTFTTASKAIADITTASKIVADITTASKIVADVTTASKIVAESVGDVASGSADSGNPIKIGGKAATSLPTTVAAGNRVNALYDSVGRQVVVGALRENLGVTVTAVTSVETTIVSSSTGLRDLYGIVLANTGATATQVNIKDSNGGTVRATFYCPATDTRGLMLPVDSAIPQASTGAAWTATNLTTTATLQVTALWVTRL